MRQPPNLLQLSFAFGRVVEFRGRTCRKVRVWVALQLAKVASETLNEVLGGKLLSSGGFAHGVRCIASHKASFQILQDVIKDHNKRESTTRARLVTDEIRGLKILSRQSAIFKRQLAAIWGTDKFQYTAVPLDLIASSFLDPAAELPVDRKTNPKWAGIMTITDEKMEALHVEPNHLATVRCQTRRRGTRTEPWGPTLLFWAGFWSVSRAGASPAEPSLWHRMCKHGSWVQLANCVSYSLAWDPKVPVTPDFLTPDGTARFRRLTTRWSQLQPKTIEPQPEVWLGRVAGKFDSELDNRLSNGRAISMANQSHLLRDKVDDRPIVFRMSCMWVDALPEAGGLEHARCLGRAMANRNRQ